MGRSMPIDDHSSYSASADGTPTATTAEPREVIIAWQQGQRVDACSTNEKYLADDIRLLLPGKDPIVGKEAASRHFEEVATKFKPGPLRISHIDGPYTVFVCEGDLVAHRFRWFGDTVDGQVADFTVFNLYRVRNGKIDHFEEHYDTMHRAQYSYARELDPEAATADPETRILLS